MEVEGPEDEKRQKGRLIIIITTVLLGLITVLTAWSSYQAAKWGGIATDLTLQANSAQSQSSEASLTANQLTLLDIQLFIQWINATFQGNTDLANLYQQRMRDEAKPAFDAWLATDPFNNKNAPNSPFIMPQYTLQKRVEAQQLADQSTAFYSQYQTASQHSDDYVLTTVILASALFFTGFATRIGWRQIELTLVIFALILLAYGIYRILVLQLS